MQLNVLTRPGIALEFYYLVWDASGFKFLESVAGNLNVYTKMK